MLTYYPVNTGGKNVEKRQNTYEFLYAKFTWPEPGTERGCPYSGKPLQLNEKVPGYNGKPWTCPTCIFYFSEEDLNDWANADYPEECPNQLAAQEAK